MSSFATNESLDVPTDPNGLRNAVNARAVAMRQLTAIEKRIIDDQDDAQCILLKESLKAIRQGFSQCHIEVCNLRPDSFYQRNDDEQDAFENRMEAMNTKLASFHLRCNKPFSQFQSKDQFFTATQPIVTSIPSSAPEYKNVVLPKLTISKFNGDPLDWARFREQFKAGIIDRTDINDVSKLSYLRSFLEGEASALLDSNISCAEDFDLAWEILTSSFGRSRVVISATVKSFMAIINRPKSTTVNFKTLSEITNAYCRLQSCFSRFEISPDYKPKYCVESY
jgi:Protein of unknown function (DUF1759)